MPSPVINHSPPSPGGTEYEKKIRTMKKNSNVILHERNKYIFIAEVAQNATYLDVKYSDIVSFLLGRKLISLVSKLKVSLDIKANFASLASWDEYIKTKEYTGLKEYINREFELFKVFFERCYELARNSPVLKEKESSGQGTLPPEVIKAITLEYKGKNFDHEMRTVIILYVRELIAHAKRSQGTMDHAALQKIWVHADQMLDCIKFETIFQFETTDKSIFNYQAFYDAPYIMRLPDLIALVEGQLKRLA